MSLSFDFPSGVNDYILTLDGAIDEELCSEFLRACRLHYSRMFEPGPTMGGVKPDMKSSMDANIEMNSLKDNNLDSIEVFSTLRDKAYRALHTAIAKYRETYERLWYAPGLTDTGFRLQHYIQTAGWYRTHVDGSPWESYSSGGLRQRVLGAIIYLNTVESGGGTHFPEQNYTVEAKAGRVALFPAAWTHPHMGETPLSSDKFILSSFITCSRSYWDIEREEKAKPESTLSPLKKDPKDN